MASNGPLATPSDVEDLWRPLTDIEQDRVLNLIEKASAKLRGKCSFDLDARLDLYGTDPTNPLGIDPVIAADVVAGIVKRFLVNQDGASSTSETTGPFSYTKSFAGRNDGATASAEVRGTLQVTDADVAALLKNGGGQQFGTIRLSLPTLGPVSGWCA